jgi:WD40 repeat protein
MNRPGPGLIANHDLGPALRKLRATWRRRVLLSLLAIVSASLSSPRVLAAVEEPRAKRVSFTADVAPILVKNCLGCHHYRKPAGGLSMSTFAALKRGGKTAEDTILEPGDPDSSYLIEAIRPGASPRMPYKLPPLADGQIATLARWVAEGANFDGPSVAETRLVSLVDVLADLPKVAVKVPATEPITALAFSPDGRFLAASSGRQVLLFDAATGKPAATLGDHPGPIIALAFTPDGASLVSAGGRAGQFGYFTVWDVAKGQRRLEARGHADSILAIAIAPDGKSLATAGYDKQVLIWDLATAKPVRALQDHSDSVYALALAPGHKVLASCAADRTVKLWDWTTGKRTLSLAESTAELYTVVFTPDGSHVLAAGVDRSIRMWRVGGGEVRLERTAFGHDAPIVRLAVSPDGTMLASSAEDKSVRLWKLDTLELRETISAQADWVQALAFSPEGRRLALGSYDGLLALREVAGRKTVMVLRQPPASKPAAPASLIRNASLNPPEPRGAVRGNRLRVILTGESVGHATAVIIPEPGLTASIVPAKEAQKNRLEIDLAIARGARVGLHAIGVMTPMGTPRLQNFAVAADAEAAEREPNDHPDQQGARPVALPATLLGAIDKPGDVDLFSFAVKKGRRLVFQVVARTLGSQLRPSLELLDRQGAILAQTSAGASAADPTLTHTAASDGVLFLRIADADFGGSGTHFYRIAAGAIPYVETVFPLGVERGATARIEVTGSNLGGLTEVSLPVAASSPAGTILGVPITLPAQAPGSSALSSSRTVVVADGPQRAEHESNDSVSAAEEVIVPGGVSGHIGHEGDVDFYRFRARKGEWIIAEIYGRRLGSPIDSVIEVLDSAGQPVPRAVLRAVDQTEVAFRDHPSTGAGIRLTRWGNLAVNDYILFGRELGRIQALPRNPDDDSVFWNQQGQRLGMLETTPEQHPMSQPMYKVEIHPPGTVIPPGGFPVTTLVYTNDDGGPALGKDSRVTFVAPADGVYLVKVADVRGASGGAFGYHLVLRAPNPSFRVELGVENPNIPRGGTALVPLNVVRLDRFDGAIEVTALDLPAGVTATPVVIDRGELAGTLGLTAAAWAPAFSPPTWRVQARALPDSSIPAPLASTNQQIDTGGPSGGWITVTPEPNLKVAARPGRVEIHPGQQVTMTLAVERKPAFKGRVPIEVKNLPQGVRVLNIGLNGVLVTEAQTERSVSLLAEPWARPMVRPFYAVGKAEVAGTEDSSPPIELVVVPATSERAHRAPLAVMSK